MMLRLCHSLTSKRHAFSRLVVIATCGFFFFFGIFIFLSACQVPCQDSPFSLSEQRAELKTHLFILVLSAPSHRLARDTIRQTWLSDAPSSTALLRFFIGVCQLSTETVRGLNREQTIYEDLVLMPDLTDSYDNLTMKLLQALTWIDHSVVFQFTLKVDEDTFVRVGQLVDDLRRKPQQRLYWGFFDGRASVKKSGKWAEAHWFLCDRYLPYALGGGYLLSTDLVRYIAVNRDYLQIYLNEDISLGTWLSPLKINRIHDERFDTEFVSRGCQNKHVLKHKQNPVMMRQLHKNLHTIGRLCDRQTVNRPSYVYNWTVLPSRCCVRNSKTQ